MGLILTPMVHYIHRWSAVEWFMLPLWLLPVFQRGVPGQPGLPAAQFLEAVAVAQPTGRSLCLLLRPRLQSPASTAAVHIKPCLHEEPVLGGTTSGWPCEDRHPRPCPPRVSYPTQLLPCHVTVGLSAPQQVRPFLSSPCLNFKYASSLTRSSKLSSEEEKLSAWIWCSCIKAIEKAFFCLCLLPA